MCKKVFLAAMLLVVTMGVSAQKLSGDITPLKGQTTVSVVLDFSGTLVNGKAEEKYIAEETKEKTEEEKAQWILEWSEKMPSESYVLLISGFQKELGDNLFLVGVYPDAEYTINIKVQDITTGYFAGPFSKPSVIKADASFVKTGETTSFATIEFKNSCSGLSSTMPYFVTRVSLSFGKLGDQLGEIIYKKFKK
jgi:hypothetical protein